jgi:hypothetical protein
MTRSANHWPAFVDLLAAPLIASLGGFIMPAGAYQQKLRFPEDAEQKNINEDASARHLPDFKN